MGTPWRCWSLPSSRSPRGRGWRCQWPALPRKSTSLGTLFASLTRALQRGRKSQRSTRLLGPPCCPWPGSCPPCTQCRRPPTCRWRRPASTCRLGRGSQRPTPDPPRRSGPLGTLPASCSQLVPSKSSLQSRGTRRRRSYPPQGCSHRRPARTRSRHPLKKCQPRRGWLSQLPGPQCKSSPRGRAPASYLHSKPLGSRNPPRTGSRLAWSSPGQGSCPGRKQSTPPRLSC